MARAPIAPRNPFPPETPSLPASNEVYWSNRSAALASQEKWEEAAEDARKCVALK
jgi:hypothetical protein